MNKWVMYALLIGAGVVFAGPIRSLPLLNKLPSIG